MNPASLTSECSVAELGCCGFVSGLLAPAVDARSSSSSHTRAAVSALVGPRSLNYPPFLGCDPLALLSSDWNAELRLAPSRTAAENGTSLAATWIAAALCDCCCTVAIAFIRLTVFSLALLLLIVLAKFRCSLRSGAVPARGLLISPPIPWVLVSIEPFAAPETLRDSAGAWALRNTNPPAPLDFVTTHLEVVAVCWSRGLTDAPVSFGSPLERLCFVLAKRCFPASRLKKRAGTGSSSSLRSCGRFYVFGAWIEEDASSSTEVSFPGLEGWRC